MNFIIGRERSLTMEWSASHEMPKVDKYTYFVMYMANRLRDGKNIECIKHCIHVFEVLCNEKFVAYASQNSLEIINQKIIAFKDFFGLNDLQAEEEMFNLLCKQSSLNKVSENLDELVVAIQYTNKNFWPN